MFLKLQSKNNNNSYQDDTGINGQCFFLKKTRTLKPMNIVVENRHRAEKKLIFVYVTENGGKEINIHSSFKPVNVSL